MDNQAKVTPRTSSEAKATKYRLEYQDETGAFRGCNHFDTIQIAEFHGWEHQKSIEARLNVKHDSVNRMFTIWEVSNG